MRKLGKTDIDVSTVALGCWPIAGMTSLHVTRENSLATLHSCRDLGINFLDTAYCYGADGESELLIAEALGDEREEFVIATKCGVHWDDNKQRRIDGRPPTLHKEIETSLKRLNTDRVELLYLHAPDPDTPITDSAGALREALDAGKARSIGVSNLSVEQMEEFQQICPISACQLPYNILQRQIEAAEIPWCQQHDISVVPYWPLMKGLLAGKLTRDHVFEPGDGRAKYPMFQGEEWLRNHDFLDDLRPIAENAGKTVGQLSVAWLIHQPGITSALCGAKRPDQIQETAEAMRYELGQVELDLIKSALKKRGIPVVRAAI